MEELVERFVLMILALPKVRAALAEIVRQAAPKRRQLDLPVETKTPPRKVLRLDVCSKERKASAKRFVDRIVDAGIVHRVPRKGVRIESRKTLARAAYGMVLDPEWFGFSPSRDWLRYFAASSGIEFWKGVEPAARDSNSVHKTLSEIRNELEQRKMDLSPVERVVFARKRSVGFDEKTRTYRWGPKSMPRSTRDSGRPVEKSDW